MRTKLTLLNERYVPKRRRGISRLQHYREHPLMLPAAAFFVLFFVAMAGFISMGATTVGPSDSKVVKLYINGIEQTVPTRAETVGDLLKRLDITVQDKDIIEPGIEASIVEDGFTVNVYKARSVAVEDETGVRRTTFSAHQEPRKLAEEAGVQVYPEDIVEQDAPRDFVRDGLVAEKVVIDRAIPTTINLYGRIITVRTHAKTVEEVLREKDIKAVEGDTILPAPDTPVNADLQVVISRFGTQIITEEQAIEPPVETIDDPKLASGQTQVREEGAPGRKVVTYEVELKNEQEVGRKLLHEIVAAQPIKRVVARGVKVQIAANLTGGKVDWMNAVGIPANQHQYVDYIISRESGWCPTKWQGQRTCPNAYTELYAPSTPGVGYGLCQSTPASKMASAGSDWQVNPVTQLRWCNNYAVTRYGSWQAAYNFWSVNHWW